MRQSQFDKNLSVFSGVKSDYLYICNIIIIIGPWRHAPWRVPHTKGGFYEAWLHQLSLPTSLQYSNASFLHAHVCSCLFSFSIIMCGCFLFFFFFSWGWLGGIWKQQGSSLVTHQLWNLSISRRRKGKPEERKATKRKTMKERWMGKRWGSVQQIDEEEREVGSDLMHSDLSRQPLQHTCLPEVWSPSSLYLH